MPTPDKLTRIWNGTALTADADSTSSVDLGSQPRDISIGEPMALIIEVNVSAKVSDGNETYAFSVLTSADENLGTPTTVITRSIPKALLTAGSVHEIPLPAGSVLLEFIGATFDGGGTNPAVTVTAWFGPHTQMEKNKVFATSGFTVLS